MMKMVTHLEITPGIMNIHLRAINIYIDILSPYLFNWAVSQLSQTKTFMYIFYEHPNGGFCVSFSVYVPSQQLEWLDTILDHWIHFSFLPLCEIWILSSPMHGFSVGAPPTQKAMHIGYCIRNTPSFDLHQGSGLRAGVSPEELLCSYWGWVKCKRQI